MATQVDEALAEVKAERAELSPILEGLRNYQRLDIQPGTRTFVDEEVAKYERRDSKLDTLETALEAALADGYPDIPIREVPPEVMADLDSENREVDAAQARFAGRTEASAIGLSAGPAEPKQ